MDQQVIMIIELKKRIDLSFQETSFPLERSYRILGNSILSDFNLDYHFLS